jgi:single-strand selective monofunctional uracil DNA glycosylase
MDRLAAEIGELSERVEGLVLPRAAYRYNPLRYAWGPHLEYLRRYGLRPRRVLLLGMNPGPWGMAQTGIPFGDPVMVRDWMGITAKVDAFPEAHRRVPVRGFDSHRREGSGTRLYSWARSRFGTADDFFSTFFVANYFPLLLLDQSGTNLTPAILTSAERASIANACDPQLSRIIRRLQPEVLLGVGRYAAAQLERVVKAERYGAQVGCILHPSPANPRANRSWEQEVETELRAHGIDVSSYASLSEGDG